MQLTSSAFQAGHAMPAAASCDGVGVNPSLTITEVPATTKSLVLIVHDPDAPSGDFVHWLVWNIDPTPAEIAEHSVPVRAVEGTNSAGQLGYFPACPPNGRHRYLFELSALDTKIELPTSTTRDQLAVAMAGHVVVTAQLMGTYQR